MSERDESTGQFTEAAPAFGIAGVEKEAGYVPFKEETSEDNSELSISEAAEQIETAHTAESDVRTYSPFSDLDSNVTLTEEQGAKALSDMEDAEAKAREDEINARVQKEVDELRGEDKSKAEAEKAEDAEPDLEKVFSHPKVREALQQQFTETEETRAEYQRNLQGAQAIALASFLNQFPEFNGVDPQYHPQVLAQIRQDPARYAQYQRAMETADYLAQQHAAEQKRIDAQKQTRLQQYIKDEGDKFEAMVANVPKAERAQIESCIVEAIQEYGGDKSELLRFMQSSEFNSAIVQRLLFDVGRLRMIQKAPKAVAARAPLPHVVRPGVSVNKGDGDSETLATLMKQLDGARTENQQLKIGRKILELRGKKSA